MMAILISALSAEADLPSASPVIIAHRGNSYFAPENTLASFQAAIGKADMIEFDVHVTLDGKFVVMHDVNVARTSNGTGVITGMTFDQLRELDVGAKFHEAFTGERIPSFEEAVDCILPHAVPLVEQKTGTAADYVAEIHRLGIATNIVLQSFDWKFIKDVHDLDSSIPLAVLGQQTLNGTTITNILNTGASTAAFYMTYVTPSGIQLLADAGLSCFVWTVDGINIPKYVDMGVDGVISNDPALGTAIRDADKPVSAKTIEKRMLAYWDMDGDAGTPGDHAVMDRYGISDAALCGPDIESARVGAPQALFGSSLALDGSKSFAAVPTTTALDINTNAMSFAAWIFLPSFAAEIPTSTASIFDSQQGAYGLYLDRAAKELRFGIADTNAHVARPGIPDSRLLTNEWIHVVGTFSGASGLVSGQARIYVNGQLADVHTGNDTTARRGLTQNVMPGQLAAMGLQGPTGDNGFAGLLDDVSVWARELNPAEIKYLHNQGKEGLSLGALLPPPGDLLRFTRIRTTHTGRIEITVDNAGPWSTVKIQRSDDAGFGMVEEPDCQPVELGDGLFRFDLPVGEKNSGFYRLMGR